MGGFRGRGRSIGDIHSNLYISAIQICQKNRDAAILHCKLYAHPGSLTHELRKAFVFVYILHYSCLDTCPCHSVCCSWVHVYHCTDASTNALQTFSLHWKYCSYTEKYEPATWSACQIFGCSSGFPSDRSDLSTKTGPVTYMWIPWRSVRDTYCILGHLSSMLSVFPGSYVAVALNCLSQCCRKILITKLHNFQVHRKLCLLGWRHL